ncbi:MAG: hypothetical protein AWU59_2137 [Methanolobus sp. T82-4]|nr:MAG: hypothetical protein AWU59_2137 [Methanolobus sp. T82-4]
MHEFQGLKDPRKRTEKRSTRYFRNLNEHNRSDSKEMNHEDDQKMSETITIPVLNNRSDSSNNNDSDCGQCGKGGCCGGFGIKAGSEKDVVYRNIMLYAAMGLIIFTVTYLIKELLTALT